MAKSADPCAVPEFYGPPKLPDLGHPGEDPPMTVRVESWEDRMSPDVRRVIKRASTAHYPDGRPWVLASAPDLGDGQIAFTDGQVASWYPVHPLTYRVAFGHLQAEDARRTRQEIEGDMGVEAFRGPGESTP